MRLSLVRCCISPSSTALFPHPDLLPSTNWGRRNELCERLVRRDMYERRAQIVIPEFYVGSILAVSMSDLHAPGRSNRFLGICIRREREGLFHKFTLRNVIDGLGVEVLYDMYNPCVQKIEVMRLERRLDADLSYLIDALPEYSTFDVNMEPIFHLAGTPVPVNDLKVKLKDPPWSRRWEMFDVNGIADSWTLVTPYYKRKTLKTKLQPWLKYDLIRDYRNSHWAEDEQLIMEEKQRFEVMKQQQKDDAVGVKSG